MADGARHSFDKKGVIMVGVEDRDKKEKASQNFAKPEWNDYNDNSTSRDTVFRLLNPSHSPQ